MATVIYEPKPRPFVSDLAATMVDEQLNNLQKRQDLLTKRDQIQKFYNDVSTTKSRGEAVGVMSRYPQILQQHEDVSNALKVIDQFHPLTDDKPVEVTAHSEDGTKSKTLYIPQSRVAHLDNPDYVHQLFGPEYSMVKGSATAKEKVQHFDPNGQYVGDYVAGQGPTGSVAKPTLDREEKIKADTRADQAEKDRQEQIRISQASLDILSQAAVRNMGKDQKAAYDQNLIHATTWIDEQLKTDPWAALEPGKKARIRDHAAIYAEQFTLQGSSYLDAGRRALEQANKDELDAAKVQPAAPESTVPTPNPAGSAIKPYTKIPPRSEKKPVKEIPNDKNYGFEPAELTSTLNNANEAIKRAGTDAAKLKRIREMLMDGGIDPADVRIKWPSQR